MSTFQTNTVPLSELGIAYERMHRDMPPETLWTPAFRRDMTAAAIEISSAVTDMAVLMLRASPEDVGKEIGAAMMGLIAAQRALPTKFSREDFLKVLWESGWAWKWMSTTLQDTPIYLKLLRPIWTKESDPLSDKIVRWSRYLSTVLVPKDYTVPVVPGEEKPRISQRSLVGPAVVTAIASLVLYGTFRKS